MSENISDNLPNWLRIFYIVLGSITAIFGIIIMINAFDETILVLLLGIVLLLNSLSRFIIGNFDNKLHKEAKISNMIIGVVLLAISIVAIAGYFTISIEIILVLLAIAIILVGIQKIVRGYLSHTRKMIYRVSIITSGYILIGLSTLTLGYNSLEDKFKILILGASIVIIGIVRIAEGLIGKQTMKQPQREYV
ncbi:MAG TPA: hypothetical protein VMX55_05935 [candidate division Zixibacteria bacterium]|nr:hypothetical protein [candidate division Zixibacteria bacterium]